ncbi:MAG: O-antigen ligase family protein [Hyphomicrobiaceae bacterium]
MFNGEPDSLHRPLATRVGGILPGTVLMLSAIGLAIASRAAPFYLGALLLCVLAVSPRATWRRGLQHAVAQPLVAPLALLIGYASLSALWAHDPAGTLEKSGVALAVVAVTSILAVAFASRDRIERLHIAEGLWIGLLVACAYTVFEIATDQLIVRTVVNTLGIAPGTMRPPQAYLFRNGRLVHIDISVVSRNIAPLVLLLWPAMMGVRGYIAAPYAIAVSALLLSSTGLAVMMSPHETSKAAFLLGLVVWLVAHQWPRVAGFVARAGWLAACLLPIPVAIGLHAAGLHTKSWLPVSARHRVEIWNYSARDTLAAPIFGNGAMTTYATVAETPPERRNRLTPPHQHNVYLQVWQELGLVGAILLLPVGWRLLAMIAALDTRARPYGYAFVASAATIASSSYGIWQLWFMALYGMAAVAFVVGLGAGRDRPA